MASNFLSKLNEAERKQLVKDLWEIQGGKCFITEEEIDLDLHYNQLDIDHVKPLILGGKDDRSNLALTFYYANRTKQAANLELARILFRFKIFQEKLQASEDRSPNLDDILKHHSGSKHKLLFKRENNTIQYSLTEKGNLKINKIEILKDKLSSLEYFFINLPIEYIFHDEKINPRSIGNNISKLIEEFYSGNPQLHISLGWIGLEEGKESVVRVFDGQHKAAAQIMLGIKELPVRVFINPDEDLLIKTNFRAGTVLRQVAFDKSIQRHLGNTLYFDRVKRYQEEKGLEEDFLGFSERDLANFYKGESREFKRYVIDSVRDYITRNSDNKLMEFVDLGGRAKEKPISYSSVEKTFYSFFIYQDLLETPISYKLEEGKNPRSLEKEQLVHLMNIIAEEIYIDKFDFALGTFKIENKIQHSEYLPSDHIKAYRMSKEEIIFNWLKFLSQIIKTHFISLGHPVDEKKLFQYEFSEALWNNIRNYIRNLSLLPLWTNLSLSNTIFGGKQNYQFWHTIFTTGSSPQGVKALANPINLLDLQMN